MHKILIVDDDELQLALERSILMELGYLIYATADGPHGLEIFKRQKIDLVLLDLGMPSMNGLDVLKEIKKLDPNAKVIIVTGYPSADSSAKAKKYGALDYIPKPVDVDKLIQKIQSVLQER